MIGVLGVLAACGDDATPRPTATTAADATATPTLPPGVTPTATPTEGDAEDPTPTQTPIPTATPTPLGERPEYGCWLYTGRSNRTAVDAYSTTTGTSYLWADYEALLGYDQRMTLRWAR